MTEPTTSGRDGIDTHVRGTARGEDWEGRHPEAGAVDDGTDNTGSSVGHADDRFQTGINPVPRRSASQWPSLANQRYLAHEQFLGHQQFLAQQAHQAFLAQQTHQAHQAFLAQHVDQ